uniref:WH2 domain-containing protein n=1 Tax=Acrobeloides nanus TaxID=290746 RepID=A0A914DS77_9BILA
MLINASVVLNLLIRVSPYRPSHYQEVLLEVDTNVYSGFIMTVTNRIEIRHETCSILDSLLTLEINGEKFKFGCLHYWVHYFESPVGIRFLPALLASLSDSVTVVLTAVRFACPPFHARFRQCPNHPVFCISRELFCDNIDNCGFHSDEADCTAQLHQVSVVITDESLSFEASQEKSSTPIHKQFRDSNFLKPIARQIPCKRTDLVPEAQIKHRTLSLINIFNMSKKSSTSTKKKRLSFFNIFPWRKRKNKEGEEAVAQSDPSSPPESRRVYTKNTPRSVKNGSHFQNGISSKKFQAPSPPQNVENEYIHQKGFSMDDLQVDGNLQLLDYKEKTIDLETKSCSALPILESTIPDRQVGKSIKPSTSEIVTSDHEDSGVDSSKSENLESTETPATSNQAQKNGASVDEVQLLESVTETIRMYNKEIAPKMTKPDEARPSNAPPPLPVSPPPPARQYPRRKYKFSSRTSSESESLKQQSVDSFNEVAEPPSIPTPSQTEKQVYVITKSSNQVPHVARLSNFNLKTNSSVPPIRVSSFEEEPIQVSIESITISDSKPIDNKMVNTSWEDANVEVDAKLNAEYKKLTSLFEQWQVMCLNRENLKTTDGIRLQEALITQHRVVHQLCEKAHGEGRTHTSSASASSIRSNASAKKRISIMTPDVFTPRNDPLVNQTPRRNLGTPDPKRFSHISIETKLGTNGHAENGLPKRMFGSPSVVRRTDNGPSSRRIYSNQRPALNKAASVCEDSYSDDDSSSVTLLSSRTFSSVDVSFSPNEEPAPTAYNNNYTKATEKQLGSGSRYRVNHSPPKSPLNIQNGLLTTTSKTYQNGTSSTQSDNMSKNLDKNFTSSTHTRQVEPRRQVEPTRQVESTRQAEPTRQVERTSLSPKPKEEQAKTTQKYSLNGAPPSRSNGVSRTNLAPGIKPTARFDGFKGDVEESRKKYEERKKQNVLNNSTSVPSRNTQALENETRATITAPSTTTTKTTTTAKATTTTIAPSKQQTTTAPSKRSPPPMAPREAPKLQKTNYGRLEQSKNFSSSLPHLAHIVQSKHEENGYKSITVNGSDSNENSVFGATLRKVGMPTEKIGMQLGRVIDTPQSPTTDESKENARRIPEAPPLPPDQPRLTSVSATSNGPPPAPRLDPNVLRSQLQTVRLKPPTLNANSKENDNPKDNRDLLMEAIRKAGGARSLKKTQTSQ